MTKRIKYLSLLMAVIMCFTLFVGCKRDVKTEPPDTDGIGDDTTAKTPDTTAKPAGATPPTETNPPETYYSNMPPKFGMEGYAGSYASYPLICFTATEAKDLNIPKDISIIKIINNLYDLDDFEKKYYASNAKVGELWRELWSFHENNTNSKTIILSVPVQPQHDYEELYLMGFSKRLESDICMDIRCYSDRWEIDMKDVPLLSEANKVYAGYVFYAISSEVENSHDKYVINTQNSNNTNYTSEITDFTQYQFRMKNSVYSNLNRGSYYKNKEEIRKTLILEDDFSNEDFPISPKELINQLDDKFLEEHFVYIFKTKYKDKDSAYKITKVFGDKNGIAVFYDGKELESTPYWERGGDETAIVTMLFLPKSVGEYNIKWSDVFFQQDPSK